MRFKDRRQRPFFLPGLLEPEKVPPGLNSHSQETSTVLHLWGLPSPTLQLHPTVSQTRDRYCHVGSSRYTFWAGGFAWDLQKLGLEQAPPSCALSTLSDSQALPSVGPQDLCSPSPTEQARSASSEEASSNQQAEPGFLGGGRPS